MAPEGEGSICGGKGGEGKIFHVKDEKWMCLVDLLRGRYSSMISII